MNLNLVCEGLSLQTVRAKDNQLFFIVEEKHIGKPFQIIARNELPDRVAFFMSVEGVCVQTGSTNWRNYMNDCKAYVLQGYQSHPVRGFRSSSEAEQEFVFTAEELSYANYVGGDNNSKGAIGVIVWTEKKAHRQPMFFGGDISSRGPVRSCSIDTLGGSRGLELESNTKGVGVGAGREVVSRVTSTNFDWDREYQRVQIRFATRQQLIDWGVLDPPVPRVTAFPTDEIYAPTGAPSPY